MGGRFRVAFVRPVPPMPRLLLRSAAVALAFATPAFASETVSKAQVLEAIRTFEANAVGSLAQSKSADQEGAAVAKASNIILKFAIESDDVVVDLGADAVPWCDVKKGLQEVSGAGQRGLLLAAYVCGSVRAQLQSGKQDPNPLAGWVAMLRVYRAMRIREGVEIPEVETLLARQANGSLEASAAAALRRSRERLRKAYGATDPPAAVPQP
jgi:hypothetical protein